MSVNDALETVAQQLIDNGQSADTNDCLSKENYQLLKELRFFSALVPSEYGGLGLGYREVCELLGQLASYHPSTALSCSMHQHIVAANRYNDLHGKPGRALLEKVAGGDVVLECALVVLLAAVRDRDREHVRTTPLPFQARERLVARPAGPGVEDEGLGIGVTRAGHRACSNC